MYCVLKIQPESLKNAQNEKNEHVAGSVSLSHGQNWKVQTTPHAFFSKKSQ
jgi:hypothetical protein